MPAAEPTLAADMEALFRAAFEAAGGDMPPVDEKAVAEAEESLVKDEGPEEDEEAEEDDELGDTDERAELMADILAGLFGAEALQAFEGEAKRYAKKWNPLDHPRGKGGRFIPKGSAEAQTAAKEVIGRVLAGDKTPESAEKVMEHLNILTVKQLKELHKAHGKPAGHRELLVAGIKERLDASAGKAAETPWSGGAAEPGKVYNAPTGDLKADPSRFQYKVSGIGAGGVTEELKGIGTWNPDFAGVISVWQDPADGKTYVVNGHHRFELAGRLGVEDLAVRYVTAGSAKEARAVGALINIAEGRGTALDAAKFMRDTGTGPEEMAKHGVSLKGKVAADAAQLTKLSDRSFDRLSRGLLDESKALAVAKHLGDHSLQDQLFKMLDKREEEGKDISPKVIEEMAREMAQTPTASKTESSLFGDIESTESLFVERNEVKAHVRTELGREVRDFLAVASKRRAERVGGAGNVLDTERNKQIAQDAERVLNVYDTLVNRKGDISDAVNGAAGKLAAAKTKRERDAVRQEAVKSVRDAVFAEAGVGQADAGGKEGGVSGGAEAPGKPAAAPAAPDAGRGSTGPAGVVAPAPAEHTAGLKNLGVGELGTVGGVKVRRLGEDSYRVETPTGHITGDAGKVASHIAHENDNQKLYGRAHGEALERANRFQEPDWTDAAGQDRAERAFASLPDGVPVVSLDRDAGTHGRTGRIVKDEDGRNRVKLDGVDGFASSYVEPLDRKLSWRVPDVERQAEAAAREASMPKQAGMFSRHGTPDRYDAARLARLEADVQMLGDMLDRPDDGPDFTDPDVVRKTVGYLMSLGQTEEQAKANVEAMKQPPQAEPPTPEPPPPEPPPEPPPPRRTRKVIRHSRDGDGFKSVIEEEEVPEGE